MYLVVMMLGLVFKARKFVYAGVTCLFAAVVIFWCWREAPLVVYYGTDVRNIFLTGIYFMLGACYAKFGVERWFSLSGVCILVLAAIMLAPYPGISKVLLWLTLPYVVLAFGLSRSWIGTYFNRLGDCSYGVYIYAFPVQQFVLQMFPGISYQAYLLSTVIITLILGYVSWHLIEKRILKFKPKKTPLPAESKNDAESPGLAEKI
jgi:peptidoglycan/LPS O-acetylase OafA/YrhL